MTDPALTRIANALEKLVDAYTQAQRRDHYARTDWYATDEERQREEELEDAPAPVPLDENDHRDRIDTKGQRWTHRGDGTHPWCLESCYCSGVWNLYDIHKSYGSLRFADGGLK